MILHCYLRGGLLHCLCVYSMVILCFSCHFLLIVHLSEVLNLSFQNYGYTKDSLGRLNLANGKNKVRASKDKNSSNVLGLPSGGRCKALHSLMVDFRMMFYPVLCRLGYNL